MNHIIRANRLKAFHRVIQLILDETDASGDIESASTLLSTVLASMDRASAEVFVEAWETHLEREPIFCRHHGCGESDEASLPWPSGQRRSRRQRFWPPVGRP